MQQSNKKISHQSALNTCIADYNKSVTNKKWLVDTMKRKIIGNLLQIPAASISFELVPRKSDEHSPEALGAKKDDDDEHDGGEPDDDVKKRPATRPGFEMVVSKCVKVHSSVLIFTSVGFLQEQSDLLLL